ncbi:MAG: histidine phosphatase family protein [Anaerolineales bacterium]|jgi:probable phosphomutase (TIGR03848 family)
MTVLYLIRHAQNEYVAKGKLAGRLPQVHLDERGRQQAEALAGLLKTVRFKAIYASPLERAMETAVPLAAAHGKETQALKGLLEIDYGKWQGYSLKALHRRKLWSVIQHQPSLAHFPDGESFAQAQARIVATLESLRRRHRSNKACIACVFHSDPIKLAIAHYLGLPIDLFQRLTVEPASVSILAIGDHGSRLVKMNDNRATHHPGAG